MVNLDTATPAIHCCGYHVPEMLPEDKVLRCLECLLGSRCDLIPSSSRYVAFNKLFNIAVTFDINHRGAPQRVSGGTTVIKISSYDYDAIITKLITKCGLFPTKKEQDERRAMLINSLRILDANKSMLPHLIDMNIHARQK
jgi:hypothetical protein